MKMKSRSILKYGAVFEEQKGGGYAVTVPSFFVYLQRAMLLLP